MCTSYHHRSWPVKSFHGNLFPLNIPCFALSPLHNVASNISSFFSFFVDKRGSTICFGYCLFFSFGQAPIRHRRVVGQRHELTGTPRVHWNALRSKHVTCSPNICFGVVLVTTQYALNTTLGVWLPRSLAEGRVRCMYPPRWPLVLPRNFIFICVIYHWDGSRCANAPGAQLYCVSFRLSSLEVFTPQDYLSVFAGEVVFYTISSAVTCSGYSVRAEWDSSKLSLLSHLYFAHFFLHLPIFDTLLGANAHLFVCKRWFRHLESLFNLTPWNIRMGTQGSLPDVIY